VTWVAQREEVAKAQRRQEDQAHEIALRESQKPFLEKQLAFYFEAAKVTSKLATLVIHDQLTLDDWLSARKRFWELYWGKLGVVESGESQPRW
jgi:hypothetical protein